jgi:hypothetical protein
MVQRLEDVRTLGEEGTMGHYKVTHEFQVSLQPKRDLEPDELKNALVTAECAWQMGETQGEVFKNDALDGNPTEVYYTFEYEGESEVITDYQVQETDWGFSALDE